MGGKWVRVVENEYYPLIKAQWDRERNGEVELSSLSQANRTPVFFRCSNCDKPFKKSIAYVIKSGGIILCTPCHRVSINAKIGKANAISNRKDITEERAARLKEVESQWDEKKNGESIHSDGIRTYSSYWWRCSLNHSWNTTMKARFNGNNCPYCSNRKVLPGYNDLATTHPELAKWYSESNELNAREITAASKATVLWSDHGHEWSGVVREMAKNPNCHCCSSLVSNAEKEVLEYLVELGVPRDEIEANTRKVIPPKEIDIYVPSLQLAIEYNGAYWHSHDVKKDTQYHYDKWLACKRRSIRLITIWEMDWINSPNEVKSILAKAVRGSKESTIEIRMSQEQESNVPSFQYEVLLNEAILEEVQAKELNDGVIHLSSDGSTEFLGNVVRRIKEYLSPRIISMELHNDDQEWRGLVREGFAMAGEATVTSFEVKNLQRIAVGDSTIESGTLTIFDTGVSSWLWEGDIPLTPP